MNFNEVSEVFILSKINKDVLFVSLYDTKTYRIQQNENSSSFQKIGAEPMRVETIRGFIDLQSGHRCIISEVDYTDAKNKVVATYNNQFIAGWDKNQFRFFNWYLRESLPLFAEDLFNDQDEEAARKRAFFLYRGKPHYSIRLNAYMLYAQIIKFILGVLEVFRGDTVLECVQEGYVHRFLEKYNQDRHDQLQELETSPASEIIQTHERRFLDDLEMFIKCSGEDQIKNYYHSRDLSEFLTFRVTGSDVFKNIEIQFFRELQQKLEDYIEGRGKICQDDPEKLRNFQKFKKDIDEMLSKIDKKIQQNSEMSKKSLSDSKSSTP